MKNAIVITTINKPTLAIIKYSKMENISIIVVGDRKTPEDWEVENVTFLSLKEQKKRYARFCEHLPENHYCRKMIGYLYAMEQGAENIIDTDDDNHPYPNWHLWDDREKLPCTMDHQGFINIYSYFSDKKIWPRGFPLMKINDMRTRLTSYDLVEKKIKVGIWQGLADKDPDVDAIYRLTDNSPTTFEKRGVVVLGKGTLCPINSQNTVFNKAMFPLLYLPSHVSFRFTDILRGLVAQPIAWKNGYRIGFTDATVYQDRNLHNYLEDFESEIPCYQYGHLIPDIVVNGIRNGSTILQDLAEAYLELAKHGIIKDKEMEVLRSWISEIQPELDDMLK